VVIPYIVFFILCCVALYYAGNWVVEALSNLAKILRWKEFVTAFFIMALAATLPNLFLAIASVANHVPELSLGDVMGGNVFDMTLAIALAVFFQKRDRYERRDGPNQSAVYAGSRDPAARFIA